MRNYIYRLSAVILLLSGISVYSQTQLQSEELLRIARDAEIQYRIEKAAAESLAVLQDLPIKYTTSAGVTMELQRFDKYGMPVYYATDNSISSQTISTNKTYKNQIGGFTLSGNGQILGVWDAGAVLATHQELTGRVTQMDGAGSTHEHSTHVAGTLVAEGVDARAKGMSYEGILHAYDWGNDYGELSTAAANGLKVSSHSYGVSRGWAYDYRGDGKWAWMGNTDVSPTEDYSFGFYDNSSFNWDYLLYTAPNLLICKSAGNDRGDGPTAGTEHWVRINGVWTLSTAVRQRDGGVYGYDCMGDGRAVAKNTLSVGAVSGLPGGYSNPQGVSMSSFSSWGPTDDGRIKPDVVTDGVNLYSTSNAGNTSYTTMSGTSMATPSAAGAVGILLQQQAALYGSTNPFRSATMKGLIIHTADETGGNEGPDYSFGWGLMNTYKAVKTLTLDAEVGGSPVIRELLLNQAANYQYPVQSNGNQPLKVTICWTDPQGNVGIPVVNDPAIKLINDLDLRISGPGGTYLPWVLDGANPTAPAAKGDNIRDNVEQVVINAPAAGNYTISVTHKGTLTGNQQYFSMIVSGIVVAVPDTVTLLEPLNYSTGVATKPYMMWKRSPKSQDFQLQIALDNQFTNIVIDSIIPGVYVQFYTNLPELKTLYWRVRGLNSGGAGQWSQVWSFGTELAIPDPPQLITPVNGVYNVHNNSKIVWTTESTVEFFKAQISNNVLFTNIFFSDSTLTDTSVTLANMLENKKYYWRVRGKNAAGIGEFSTIQNFFSAVNAPDSLTAELINDTAVKLNWKDKSSVENRFYILRKDGEAGTFALIDSLNSNSVTYTDTGLALSTTYKYRVFCGANYNYSDSMEVTISTPLDADENKNVIPAVFELGQNYPNPFNPSTTIRYSLPVESSVKIVVYNAIGQTVSSLVNTSQRAGYYETSWNAADISSGIYFYTIEASALDGSKDFRQVRKMLLLK